MKIYDTTSQSRITFLDRPADSPRADLFKCNLHWQDENTLLIVWADQIKVARVRTRPRKSSASNLPPLLVEITAVFQLDCMVSGIVPHPMPSTAPASASALALPTKPNGSVRSTTSPALTAFLIVAYSPPDTTLLSGATGEAVEDRAAQARKVAERPELRIISRSGEELAADALGISGYERWGCNDYVLVEIESSPAKSGGEGERYYAVMSPLDIVVVKPRDWRDHVAWLVERKQYEEALEVIERMGNEPGASGGKGAEKDKVKDELDAVQIGQRYIEHLVGEGDFIKAARLCPKVCGQDTRRWEDWIFVFAQKHQLQAIIPFVPTESPTLSHMVYGMVLAHFLSHDRQVRLRLRRCVGEKADGVPCRRYSRQSRLGRRESTTSPQSLFWSSQSSIAPHHLPLGQQMGPIP